MISSTGGWAVLVFGLPEASGMVVSHYASRCHEWLVLAQHVP